MVRIASIKSDLGNNDLLSVNSLYMIYKSKAEHASVVALKSVSFKVQTGEFVAIVGPSGSGKSTLLKILGGLMRPTAGRVVFEGQEIAKIPEEELTIFRREKIGFVFQEGNLLPHLSAFENVSQCMALNGISYSYRNKRTLELLDLMGVLHRKTQLAHRLSGGEKQRVAIARAMANEPKLIIADEPTGNVDFKNSVRLLELFKQLNRETEMSFVIATHSNHVAGYADRSIELRDGLLLGEHGKGIDLSQLDMSRMVIMDSDYRVTIPANITEQLGTFGNLWAIDVVEQSKLLLTPLVSVPEEAPTVVDELGETKECPVCGAVNILGAKICSSCGAKF
ncbi:MAG: ATP-binding cassette domain-containing protein [Candidatus Hodarchaeales archaeon]|jgi:putative ABC transport system ATP-binding protein